MVMQEIFRHSITYPVSLFQKREPLRIARSWVQSLDFHPISFLFEVNMCQHLNIDPCKLKFLCSWHQGRWFPNRKEAIRVARASVQWVAMLPQLPRILAVYRTQFFECKTPWLLFREVLSSHPSHRAESIASQDLSVCFESQFSLVDPCWSTWLSNARAFPVSFSPSSMKSYKNRPHEEKIGKVPKSLTTFDMI